MTEKQLRSLIVGFGMFFLVQVVMWLAFGLVILIGRWISWSL